MKTPPALSTKRGVPMLAKLVTVVLALGVVGCGVLSMRQARLQAASELAQAQVRIAMADDTLTALRADVAQHVAPIEVERVASAAGPLRPATNDIPRSLLAKELKGLAPVYAQQTVPYTSPQMVPGRASPAKTTQVKTAQAKPAKKGDASAKPQRVAARPD